MMTVLYIETPEKKFTQFYVQGLILCRQFGQKFRKSLLIIKDSLTFFSPKMLNGLAFHVVPVLGQ